ncbi:MULTISPECIES: hypothetical protein [Sphingomonas]|uniref:hypothetical protein n=1 Tax=Sphingomonas TaxID=13687 RepID=UPI00126A666A|nr:MULTISPECIES: hypothetical protein [Sphingomonas]
MKKALLAFCALIISTPALAGTAGYGPPINVLVAEWGMMLFNLPNNRSGAPACATQATRFAIPSNTDAGKSMISSVLTAQARGKQVYVNGAGNCNVWSDSETVDYVQVEN